MLPSAAAGQESRETPEALRAEAYVAAQSAMLSEAADALAKVSARFARGNDAMAPLEAAREQNVQALATMNAHFIDLIGKEDSQSQADRNRLGAERERLRSSISDADRQIEALDPAYAELTRPRPLSIAETQALLTADEAVLLILPAADATYVFAVTHDGAMWSRSSLSANEIGKTVGLLRTSILADLDTGTETFDRARAFELYNSLILPVENQFRGKHDIMVVTDGALGTLPLQLLVTERPTDARTDDDAMRATHWLLDRYTLSTLPSVSSLRSLRCLLVPQSLRHPGCGSQVIANLRGSSEPSRTRIDVVGFGAPALSPPATASRGGAVPQASFVFRGELADANSLRRLPSLPGTKAELEMVRSLFGADRVDIELGEDATEARVKASKTLPIARFVLFSTHGLLASESRLLGASEPGLVLTPPRGAESARDDGLLTSSEAAKLQLSADLVMLSACNTAASDGTPGSNGLSGLARSFFFAGAHALIVSNWSVSDEATMQLVSKIFKAARQTDKVGFSQVLKNAMLEVRAMPDFAAPAYWAPFIVVGTAN